MRWGQINNRKYVILFHLWKLYKVIKFYKQKMEERKDKNKMEIIKGSKH